MCLLLTCSCYHSAFLVAFISFYTTLKNIAFTWRHLCWIPILLHVLCSTMYRNVTALCRVLEYQEQWKLYYYILLSLMLLEVLSTNSWILLTGTLPNESEVQNLPKLSRLKLRNNRITGKDPLFIPKFILDLPMWVITTQILIQDRFI